MKKIIHFVRIHSSREAVFRAITTEDGLSSWWSTAVRVADDNRTIRFTFAGDFNPVMKVTNLESDQKVEWMCEAGHDNWKDNTFVFELREVNGETGLMFVQVYAQELSDEVYGTYNYNWGYYLHSLKLFCETGAGTPFKVAHTATKY